MMLLDAPRVLYQAAGLGAHARFVVDERPALWSEYRMARRLLLAVALLLATPSAWADPDVWVHDIDARLGTLDVATGDYAEVGITLFGTIDVPLSDIAFAPGGELYGISYETQSFVGSVLYTIDTTTAVLTRIAQSNVGHPLNALVFRNDGTLLAAGGSDLVSLDTATAASTPILSFAPHFSAGDLAFDASGDLYLTVVSGSGAGQQTNLLRLDLAGGTWELVGGLGYRDVYGLVFAPNGTMYGLSDIDFQVFPVDLVTGVGGTGVSFGASGLAGALGASFLGEAATTTTTLSGGSTTTTTFPSNCPFGATFSSILCRIAELAAATADSEALGSQKVRLEKTVAKANTLAMRARDRCADTEARNARKKAGKDLKKTAKKLSGYRRGLRSRRARKKLAEEVRSEFLARVEPVLADVKILRPIVDCPADAGL
jgi:hypothetical protein